MYLLPHAEIIPCTTFSLSTHECKERSLGSLMGVAYSEGRYTRAVENLGTFVSKLHAPVGGLHFVQFIKFMMPVDCKQWSI